MQTAQLSVEDINRFMTDGGFASSAKHTALTNSITLFNRFSEEVLIPEEIFDSADDEVKQILTMYQGYIEQLNEVRKIWEEKSFIS